MAPSTNKYILRFVGRAKSEPGVATAPTPKPKSQFPLNQGLAWMHDSPKSIRAGVSRAVHDYNWYLVSYHRQAMAFEKEEADISNEMPFDKGPSPGLDGYESTGTQMSDGGMDGHLSQGLDAESDSASVSETPEASILTRGHPPQDVALIRDKVRALIRKRVHIDNEAELAQVVNFASNTLLQEADPGFAYQDIELRHRAGTLGEDFDEMVVDHYVEMKTYAFLDAAYECLVNLDARSPDDPKLYQRYEAIWQLTPLEYRDFDLKYFLSGIVDKPQFNLGGFSDICYVTGLGMNYDKAAHQYGKRVVVHEQVDDQAEREDLVRSLKSLAVDEHPPPKHTKRVTFADTT